MKKILLIFLFIFSYQLLFADEVKVIAETTNTAQTNKNIELKVTVVNSNKIAKTSTDLNIPLLNNIKSTAIQKSKCLPSWMHYKVMNVELWKIVISFLLILLGLVLRKVNNYIFLNRKWIFVGKTQLMKNVINAVGKPIGALLAFFGIAMALTILPFENAPTLNKIKSHFLVITFAIIIGWGLFKLIDAFIIYLKEYSKRTETKLDDQIVPLISKSAKIVTFILVFLWAAQTLNYKVSALLAGLGIGGLAVALGLQDTLANLFGSIFILIDRPFNVGDRIKVEGMDGIVEEIGLRSTRIRTLSKTLAAIPNKIVANTKIDNLTKMPIRKVAQTIGVTYDTTADQMELAVKEIRKIISDDSDVNKDFILVRFTDFGDSSLNISIIYFTNTVDYADYLAVKEKINLSIMRKLDELGLSIAFPSRTVYLYNMEANHNL